MSFFELGSAKKAEIEDRYDIVIIGGGPGGITASIYAMQAGLKPLIIEKAIDGGQMNNTQAVENWTGFTSVGGMELSEKMAEHARAFDVPFFYGEVVDVELEGPEKAVILDNGRRVASRVIIVATGSNPRSLGVEGEEAFKGRGISYCATCDGHFFTDKHIAVIGGGNSALDESIYLSKMIRKITIVQNLPKLTADKLLQDKLNATGKVEYIFSSVVESIEGDTQVRAIKIRNQETGETTKLPIEGMFVFIGLLPNSGFLKGKLPLNRFGYIQTDGNMETEVKGVYAIGDVREKEVRQIVTAAADGAIAVYHAARTYFDG
ncbi:MAG TPA: FAD-dependent oxidoreductase [Mesotoga sp.]|nr:FAD-dependent oxidoreductase [Mesotoga sp.]